MKTVYLFLTDGFEETEALATVDVMRRAGLSVKTVSLTKEEMVVGSHLIQVKADVMFENTTFEDAAMLVIPGGTPKFADHKGLCTLVQEKYKEGLPLGAICAAPMVFGLLGLLEGKKATCYPGFEKYLKGAQITGAFVEQDGLLVTAKGPAAALPFAYAIVEMLCGKDKAEEVKAGMLYAEE